MDKDGVGDTQPGQSSIAETEKEHEKLLADFVMKKKYSKLGNAGIDGVLFQINLLTIFLLKVIEKTDRWQLSTENLEGDAFNDLIFEQPDGAVLLQAKHRKNNQKKITYEELLSTNSKKDEFSLPKYFFAYQQVKCKFKVKNVIICTNTCIEIKKVVNKPCDLNKESMFYFEGIGKVCYTFRDKIIPTLEEKIRIYHRENLQRKNISEEIISEENIREYLNHLQFVAGYPSGEKLVEMIQKMISQSKFCRRLDPKVAYNIIHAEMIEWFRKEKGRYLNQKNGRTFFCEVLNSRYCQMLEDYPISFENDKFLTDLSVKILHLISPGECLLSVLKVYGALQPKSVLFVNLDDDVHAHNDLIDGFEDPRYTHLVLVCSKPSTEDFEEICSKVSVVFDKYNKTVVLITQAENKIAEQFKRRHVNAYTAIHENVSFMDLTKNTQARFLDKTIVFQGHVVKLGDVLIRLSNEELNRLLSFELLSKLATDTKIEVGPNVKPVSDQVCDYYICRSFNRYEQNVSEASMCLLDKNHDERIILICDSAGMGKSTVLTNMAVNIKRNYPNLWVIRINIVSYLKVLRGVHDRSLNFITITELLDSQEDTKFRSDFERELFSASEVIMMIDGVDEISPEYTDIILRLLVSMKSDPSFVKIFITTRPHLCHMLEHYLNVKSFTLEPFSKRNQIDFLCKYWTNRLDGEDITTSCCVYAQALVKKISSWIDEYATHTLAGIPLQTKMLAEIFQEKILFRDEPLEDWEGCKEFLTSTNLEPKLPRRIDLVRLYQLFIYKKRDIFIHDKSNPSGSVVAEELLKEKFEEYYGYHWVLAFEVFYGRDISESYKVSYHMCNINRKDLNETNLLKIGIIQEINGEFGFVHRTFAEYFLAECFLKELRCEVQIQILQHDFKGILFSEYSSGFRAFLNYFLQKELVFLPHSTFKAYCSIDLATIPTWVDDSDTIGCTVLHFLSREGCVGILRFLFKCSDINSVRNPGYRSGARSSLAKRKKDVDIEDDLGRTPLQVAAACGHLDVIKLLLNRQAKINHEDKNGITPLYEAVAAQDLDVVKYLIENGAKVNSTIGDKNGGDASIVDGTVLHLAAHRSNSDMVKLLVQKGAKVNIRNKDRCTALHLAARNGNIKMVKFLLGNYAKINAQNKLGRTALHEAVRERHFELCSVLMDHKINSNIKNIFGCTAFHEEIDSWIQYKDWRANRYDGDI